MVPIEKQIIDLITKKAEAHYSEYIEMRNAFGESDKGTRHSVAQWYAVSTILEEVEELINQQNNK
jgi:hypothetical protein